MHTRLPDHEHLDLTRSALVVVDMQNDFCRPGSPREVPESRVTMPAIARLLAAARQGATPVIYTKFVGTARPALVWRFNPEIGTDLRFCRPGHRRRYGDRREPLDVTEIVDELTPEPDDPVVEKLGYDSFHGTRLLDLLRERGADTVVLVGTVTQICVDSTARGAFHDGIWPVVVSDAVSSFDDQLHAASLRVIRGSFGDVRTTDEVLAAWSAGRAGATAGVSG